MISIRRYLDSRADQVADALLHITHLLLEGIEHHAVRPDAAEYDKFCRDLHLILGSLKPDTPASEILVLAGQALKTLEEYNGRATAHMQAQCGDLQNMIAMLTKTMAAIASGSQATISRLQNIEGELQKASMLEDFHAAKIRMAECLDVLRGEIVRHRAESSRQVAEMHSAVQCLQTKPAPTPEEIGRLDPLTNLAERAAAEAALSEALKGPKPAFAAVFVSDRLDLINARFGRAVGDDVLLFFSQYVSQMLGGTDRLFRWTGPALLAILRRNESLTSVRETVNRLFAKRLTMNVTVENRSVMLAVAAKWMVFSTQEIRPLPHLIKRIDAFVHGDAPEVKALAAG